MIIITLFFKPKSIEPIILIGCRRSCRCCSGRLLVLEEIKIIIPIGLGWLICGFLMVLLLFLLLLLFGMVIIIFIVSEIMVRYFIRRRYILLLLGLLRCCSIEVIIPSCVCCTSRCCASLLTWNCFEIIVVVVINTPVFIFVDSWSCYCCCSTYRLL